MIDKPAYRLFDRTGAETLYGPMVDHLATSAIVLFGELHVNPIVHWLQYEVTKDLFAGVGNRLIVGAEMFEADDQIIIDEYMAGTIGHDNLTAEAKVWDNYETDYRPIVEFARMHGVPFIGTNIPRRYARLVARSGLGALEKLSDQAKKWIAPLPIPLDLKSPTYRDLLVLGTAHGMEAENFLAAQAIKDATMAHFILTNRSPERLFLHLNGEYHSRRYGGIFWYLRQTQPDLAIVTITSVEAEKRDFLDDYRDVADYTLVIPKSMTNTGGK
ncbi:MAG TPA: ChaN family lipoprotein [Candidatus Sulfobium mesophilum]|nr:ChaN family lipoprotein [Candidatus Sulfobium mesophilum]